MSSLDSFWMPFTPNREFKSAPRMVHSASGVTYQSDDGRSILDGTSGLWCVGAGHRHPKISEAMKSQIDVLDFASSFQVGHPGAFQLADRIASIAPPGLDRVFLVNSGSEACDTAMKLALAYWHIGVFAVKGSVIYLSVVSAAFMALVLVEYQLGAW